MSEWKEYRLGDILSIKSGFSYKGKYIGTGNSLLLGMGCVSFKEKFLISGARPYSGPYDERYKVHSGDIVLATRQQSDNLPILAMPAMVPDTLQDKDIVIGTNLYKVEINDTTFSNVFIYWLLKTKQYVNYIAGVKTGTTVSMVTKKNVEDFTFFAPTDPKEREEIVSIISYLDDKIEVNRRINDNLEQQAQALFKSWFVDFEPFCDKPFFESELGMIPEGWRVERIEDLCSKIASGGTPKSLNQDYYSGDIRWFSTKELRDGFLFDSEKHISEDALNNSAAKLFPENTILMAIYASPTVGRLGIITQASTFNQAAIGMVPKNNVSKEFLYLSLLSERVNLNNLASGAAQQNLNVGIVKNYRIIVPDNDTLYKFTNIVSDLFCSIRVRAEQNLRLASIRDTLLPRLMSGELEVKDIEDSL